MLGFSATALTVVLTAVAGIGAMISGIFGLAGGTLLVVVMFALGLSPAVAVPLHAMVQLVSNGSRSWVFRRALDRPALLLFLLTALPTPFIVGPWIQRLDPRWIRLSMGLFILLVSWVPLSRLRLQRHAGLLVAGALAGGCGMVVGATGTLIAPFFLRDQWSKETVIGTKALCQAAAHLIKIAAFSLYGFSFVGELHLALPMCVAVFLGTLLGRQVGRRMDDRRFKLAFRLLLSGLALKLTVSAALALS